MQEFKIEEQTFLLHPTGAAIWKNRNVLMLSDVHLGKSAHFRKNGMAVPSAADDLEFDRLTEIISETQPDQLWVLGDLFHSEQNSEWHFFEQWVNTLEIPMTLVVGNHDIIDGGRYTQLGVRMASEIITDGLLFTHEPLMRDDLFNVAGHIHPAIRLEGAGRQRLRIACFFSRDNQLILPAFGSFTGTYVMKPRKSDRIYALADGEVICVSNGG